MIVYIDPEELKDLKKFKKLKRPDVLSICISNEKRTKKYSAIKWYKIEMKGI